MKYVWTQINGVTALCRETESQTNDGRLKDEERERMKNVSMGQYVCVDVFLNEV